MEIEWALCEFQAEKHQNTCVNLCHLTLLATLRVDVCC